MTRFFHAWMRPAIWLALLALGPALLGAAWHPRRPAWESDEITVAAARGLSAPVLWVDAREERDFETGHVPGALALNEEEWDEQLPALLDVWKPEKTVIVYCSSLSCQTSHEVARRLRDEVGLTKVLVLQGGWEGWQAAKGSQP